MSRKSSVYYGVAMRDLFPPFKAGTRAPTTGHDVQTLHPDNDLLADVHKL